MKQVIFCGATLKAVRAFPGWAKRAAGYQLDRLQHGLEPTNWKPMQSVGAGVREIRIQGETQYRLIYVAHLSDHIYVLHAFQKQSVRTRIADVDNAKTALQLLLGELNER